MNLFTLIASLLALTQFVSEAQEHSGSTNATSAQFAPTATALIANARAVASDLKLHAAEQEPIATLEHLGAADAREVIERVLTPHTLFKVNINPEMRVKVNPGNAVAQLVAGEWNYFLARIENESGTTAPLQIRVHSPAHIPDAAAWLEAEIVVRTNLPATLFGTPLEYRLVKLRGHETGLREARISLHLGQGTQDIGFRNDVDILFKCGAKPPNQEPVSSKNETSKK